MTVIGITGGSGCGKSIVSKYLSQKGLYHMDCDLIARKVVEPGSDCLKELVINFGNDILHETGELDRRKLASIAFSTEKNTKLLNEVTLKHIVSYIKNELITLEKQGKKAVLMDGATLIESGLNKICNYNLVVIAPKNNRIEHIISRDNISLEEATKRINAQKSDDFYLNIADFSINNNSTIESLYEKTEEVYRKISKLEGWEIL